MPALTGPCARCRLVGPLEAHHTRLRSQGGYGSLRRFLCARCHRLIHDHAVEDWEEWIQRTGEQEKEQDVQF